MAWDGFFSTFGGMSCWSCCSSGVLSGVGGLTFARVYLLFTLLMKPYATCRALRAVWSSAVRGLLSVAAWSRRSRIVEMSRSTDRDRDHISWVCRLLRIVCVLDGRLRWILLWGGWSSLGMLPHMGSLIFPRGIWGRSNAGGWR